MKKKIENLIKLLDDENPQTAQAAMAEMLKHENELEEYLAHHQESENVLLRKRIHQLQAIIMVRRRRKKFAKIVKDRQLSLIEGLIEVHLQWYDNDSERSIMSLWSELLATAQRYNPSTLEKLAYFMRKCGFTLSPKGSRPAAAADAGRPGRGHQLNALRRIHVEIRLRHLAVRAVRRAP